MYLMRKVYNDKVDGSSQNRLILCWLEKTGMRFCLRNEVKNTNTGVGNTFIRDSYLYGVLFLLIFAQTL
jgi:hypothetical protein